jgi:hypothetical protein
MDMQPVITKRFDGEYSTAVVGGGSIIETMWFGNDGSQISIGREIISKDTIAKKHIREFEQSESDARVTN